MAGFCIDESGFSQVTELALVFRRLNDQLSMIHGSHCQKVYKSSELDFIKVQREVEFCDLLYNGTLDLVDHDERMLLQQTINRCIVWDAEDFDIPDGEVTFRETQASCASIMFVATKALEGIAIGLISQSPINGLGVCSASVAGTATSIFHVGLDKQLERFYRFQMSFEQVTREEFGSWVHLSFPRLRFALELNSQIRRFRENYSSIRDKVINHLASINDLFLDLLIAGLQLSDACQNVGAILGVEISPESPNTHRNAAAMREREVAFKGDKIVCEFHTKISPTHDRIHFSPSVRFEPDGREFLVVGPFAEHLTT